MRSRDPASQRPDRPGSDILRGCRVAVVTSSLGVGGAELQGLALASYLHQAHGADTAYAGMAPEGPMRERCAASGVPCLVLPRVESRIPLRSWWRMAQAARTLGTWRPQVLVASTASAAVTCGLWGRSLGAAMIWLQVDEGLDGMSRSRERRALGRADAIIANGSGAKDYLVRERGVAPGRIRIIPGGLLPAPAPAVGSREVWRRRLSLPAGIPVVVMIANLHPPKDHQTLVAAWALVLAGWPADAPPPVLVLAGRHDRDHPALVARIQELGIGDAVRLPGPVEDVPGLLAASDLAVHASHSEGCPNAVLEAMAAGLAVVGSDIPALRETIGEGAAGAWLAPPGDAPALARVLMAALADPEGCRRTGEGHRARVHAEHDLEDVLARTASVIAEGLRHARRMPAPLPG